jgi:DNA-binding beta-propeller fold protein YncE
MSIRRTQITVSTLVVVTALAAATGAYAAGPVKLVLSSHVGWKVNETGGKVCLTPEKCRPGSPNGEPGGFGYPEGVAGAPDGNVYVAEQGNHRVQELTDTGEFVLMFGLEVNATTHGDICTEEEVKASGVKCKAGATGSVGGAFASPQSVAVDPVTNNVYVLDDANSRVDEYSSDGQFLLAIGGQVNATKDATPGASEAEMNLCTAASGDTCKAGVQNFPEDPEKKGAFHFASFKGDLLAVGGASAGHLLYVGDAHRVQMFDAEGKFKGEDNLSSATIALAPSGMITAIAVDDQTEELYFVYNSEPAVRSFNQAGQESSVFQVAPQIGGRVGIRAIAIDSASRLAVAAQEETSQQVLQFGYLYRASDAHLITKFTIEGEASVQGVSGIGFNGDGELYATVPQNHELLSYKPEAVAELLTKTATCTTGVEHEGAVTFDCTLNGEVNPYNVAQTEVWFEWGRTCTFGSLTPRQGLATVEVPLSVSAPVQALRPNEAFCFQLTGLDQNVHLPETLTGGIASFDTPKVEPKVLGEPSVSFVTSSSVDMFGELNPENAPSEYFFEYAPAAGKALEECPGRGTVCAGVTDTALLESAQYARIGATLEASGLQPATSYRYRLAAVSQAGQVHGTEGEFATALGPRVEAETLPASAPAPTSTLASGIVRPDGQPAVYSFELGAYNGAATQYATVFSGQTGASTGDEPKSFMLTGLQPGTTYAYRIAIHSGYGSAQGTPAIFTTPALPALLSSPPPVQMLPIPRQASFPGVTCKPGYTFDKHRKCIKKKKKKKTPRKKSRRH